MAAKKTPKIHAFKVKFDEKTKTWKTANTKLKDAAQKFKRPAPAAPPPGATELMEDLVNLARDQAEANRIAAHALTDSLKVVEVMAQEMTKALQGIGSMLGKLYEVQEATFVPGASGSYAVLVDAEGATVEAAVVGFHGTHAVGLAPDGKLFEFRSNPGFITCVTEGRRLRLDEHGTVLGPLVDAKRKELIKKGLLKAPTTAPTDDLEGLAKHEAVPVDEPQTALNLDGGAPPEAVTPDPTPEAEF